MKPLFLVLLRPPLSMKTSKGPWWRRQAPGGAFYGGVPETIRSKPFHQKVDDEIVKFTGFTSFHDLSDQTDPVVLTG